MIWVVRRRPDKVSRFILASEVERLRGPWSKVSLSVIQMSKGKWEYFRKVLDVCPKWLRETQLHSKTARAWAWAISDFLDKPMSGSTNAKINLWFQNALYIDPPRCLGKASLGALATHLLKPVRNISQFVAGKNHLSTGGPWKLKTTGSPWKEHSLWGVLKFWRCPISIFSFTY